MYSYDKLPSSLTLSERIHINDLVNLSCICNIMNCSCCMMKNHNRYTPENIQEQFNRITYIYSLKKNQIPHAKVCLEEYQFASPSPALRYAKTSRRKLYTATEPMLFGLPIQYDDQKKFSIEKLCQWPFIGSSEYFNSYRPYNISEIQSYRGRQLFKEHDFSTKVLIPMTRMTTYRKAFQEPRFFSKKPDYNSTLLIK